MLNNNTRQWTISSLHGILVILFGIIALVFPDVTITALAIYFAITIIIGGIALMVSSFQNRYATGAIWSLMVLEGLVGILIGIYILARPQSAAATLVAIIGFWSIFIGLVFIWIYSRKHLPKFTNSLYLISGLLSLLVGTLILLNPFKSLRVVVILIGIFAIVYGIISLVKTSKKITS